MLQPWWFLRFCTRVHSASCSWAVGAGSWEKVHAQQCAINKTTNQDQASQTHARPSVPSVPVPLRHLAASMSVVRGLSRAMDTGQKQSNSAATALITLGMMDDGWMIDVLRCRLQRCSCRCLFWSSFWMARHRLIEASRMSMSEKAYCHRHLHASLFEWLVRGWEGGFQETIGGN